MSLKILFLYQPTGCFQLFFYLLLVLLDCVIISLEMSVNSTPRGNSMDFGPAISPEQYFRAQKIESNLPGLFIKKLIEIVDEYFKLKPQLVKKENEIKGLFSCNNKLLETLQSLMEQQKKVVKKYNKLCQIYVKNFKQYWTTKNVEINFKDLANPISSLSEKLNIGQWKVDVQQISPLYPNKTYEQLLFTVIKRHYLNEDHCLQKMLQKQLMKVNNQSNEAVDIIRSSIRQLNTSKPTVSTMFDLLQKRKNIEKQILQLDDEYYYDIANKDNDFIAQVSRIHNYITNPTPEKLKHYLECEAQIRRSLKKKNKKYIEGLSSEFQRIQAENSDLKEEIQVLRKRSVQLEAERNDFKNKSSYWQIKASANTKRQKNASNTSIIQDSIPVGMKDTHKKLQTKISDLQNEIKCLKQQALNKQEDRKMIEAKKQLQNSNQQIQQLRLKLCHWAFQLEYQNTSDLTAKGVLDLIYSIYKDEIDEKRKRLKQSKANIQGSQISEFKITNSIPFESLKHVPNTETPPKPFQQSIIIQEPSVNDGYAMRDNQSSVGLSDKETNRETQVNEIKMTTYQSEQSPTYNIRISSKQSQVLPISLSSSQTDPAKSKFTFKKTEVPLLSISEKKEAQEQSKMHQSSKLIKDKSAVEDQPNLNNENSKYAQQLTNFIRQLQEANSTLNLEILSLKQQNKGLTEKVAEKSKIKSVFEQIESDLKLIGFSERQMIEKVCQYVVTQISGLLGLELQQAIDRIEFVLKNKKDLLRSNPENMKSIPILSKNITEQQQDNLFKSQNIMAQLLGVKKEDQKIKDSDTLGDRLKSIRLELRSGEIKMQIKSEKSISLGLKGQPLLTDENLSIMKKNSSKNERDNIIPREQSSIRIDDDQLIDIVNDFERTSRRRKQNNSENSLKFSHSNLKGSRDSQIKSSIKLIDRADKRLVQDTQFLLKIEQKIQQIKSNSELGNELYWFYKKYKQAMEALQITEAKLKEFQIKRQTCMNQLIEENGSLSNNKLQQKIFFLQQRVKQLEEKLLTQKEEYETSMGERILQIDKIKELLLPKLLKGVFPEQYNFNI